MTCSCKTKTIKMRIKYFEGATKLQKITKGNWIDVYANKDVFVPINERAMIPLGFALELPKGWEGHIVPRSSTFKTWGVIQTNSFGVIDDTYIGDGDEWNIPVYCLQSKEYEFTEEEVKAKIGTISTIKHKNNNIIYSSIRDDENDFKKCITINLVSREGTWIRKGDKIGQFRIMEVMPQIEFEETDNFGNEDRGGFGSTGKN